MENQTKKISQFSKLVRIPTTIALVAFIVVGVMQLLSWIVATLNLPYIFKIGDINLLLPVATDNMVQQFPKLFTGGLLAICQTVLSVILLGFAKTFLTLLMEDGSPFRVEVVKALKKMAIGLIVLGTVSGPTGWIAGGIAYMLSLIFEYGYTLQAQSDTTL